MHDLPDLDAPQHPLDHVVVVAVVVGQHEEVQRLLPGASVVKAINTVLAGRIVDPVLDGVSLDGYVAGDDAAAKAKVTEKIVYRALRRKLPEERQSLTHKFAVGGHEDQRVAGRRRQGRPAMPSAARW